MHAARSTKARVLRTYRYIRNKIKSITYVPVRTTSTGGVAAFKQYVYVHTLDRVKSRKTNCYWPRFVSCSSSENEAKASLSTYITVVPLPCQSIDLFYVTDATDLVLPNSFEGNSDVYMHDHFSSLLFTPSPQLLLCALDVPTY